MNFIKRWLIKRKIKNAVESDDILKELEEEIKASSKDYRLLLAEAKRRNVLIEARRRELNLRDELERGEDGLDEDDDEEEEKVFDADAVFEKMLTDYAQKVMAQKMGIIPLTASLDNQPLTSPSAIKTAALKEVDKMNDDELMAAMIRLSK